MVVLAPPRQVKGAVEDALARAVRDEASAGLVAGTGRFSCALIAPPKGGDEELFALAEQLRARVSREVGDELEAGAGRAVAAGEVRRAFHEARCALEAFIECNGQWERAARQLYCHRHTLRYRIRRVEELTGRSLDSARDRIDFWLALRGRELIGPATERIR